MECTIGIGLLGCGTVGASVAERLIRERDAIERRSGVRYDLRAIAIRERGKRRPAAIDASLFTGDAQAMVDDPRIDVLIECIGGTLEAAELVERALDRGRHVITANKDLLALQGPRLHALAAMRRVELRCEAAACGAIPIVRTLGDALAGDRIETIAGVVNGTCNTILSAMESGAEYVDALAEAQRLGYAEADPSSDVEGDDAAHKLALLVQVAFRLAVISPRIRRAGITTITKRDVARARMLGYRIRLVAAAARTPYGAAADVAPVLVRSHHPFAQTAGPQNVVRIVARDAGALLLLGTGAGGAATASAVLGDVVSTLRSIAQRRDLAPRTYTNGFDPAIDVSPFFDAFARHPELPRYPRWDDRTLDSLSNAPASHDRAYSLPGKDR